jgi:hypothetical protein
MRRERELIETIAENTLRQGGLAPRAPVDVRRLAAALRIEVADCPIDEAGRLHPQGDWAQVFLNSREPEERRRFSLAHETSHWVLRSAALDDPRNREARAAFTSEEYLCDKIAGAVLMPRAWIQEFRHSPRTLATVQTVAERAQVSLSAAVVRLRDLLGWRSTLFKWKQEQGRWTFDGEAGLFPAQHRALRTTGATRLELHRVGADPSGWSAQGLPVMVRNIEETLPGEVYINVRAGLAIALLQLPDPGRGSAGASSRTSSRVGVLEPRPA